MCKIAVEEKDESQEYRPVPVERFLQCVKNFSDRVEVYVENVCGGETRVTIWKEKKG